LRSPGSHAVVTTCTGLFGTGFALAWLVSALEISTIASSFFAPQTNVNPEPES
jgi:hypothetical protein